MHSWTFVGSVLALALERIVYAGVWHQPDVFVRICRRFLPAREPVDVLAALFLLFKGVQAVVFAAWCLVHGGIADRTAEDGGVLLAGGVAVLAGQILNISVFARLGRVGVFYGNRLGQPVRWCEGLPFSLVRHPQYVGTVLTIWGIFILVRYPAPDWAVLPLLETVYYALGSLVEHAPPAHPITLQESAAATTSDPRASTPLP